MNFQTDKNEIVEQFSRAASMASFHYASEQSGEHRLGVECENRAMLIYFANPDLQPVMDKIASRELWYHSFLKAVNTGLTV